MTDRVAARLRDGYANRRFVPPPTSEDPGFDLAAAYAVERQLAAERVASGRRIVGLKVGYANRALWRALKLQTLVWAHMYDDTVRYASGADASLPVGRMMAPRIEPEIVFKLARPIEPGADANAALASVDWMALGFEIVDSIYPDWKFRPADFVAAYGLHAALVVGAPRTVEAASVASLVEQLPDVKVRLLKNDTLAAEGAGRNALRSPALCLAELAAAVAASPGAEPLGAGDLVSTGTLTDAQPIAAEETWRAEIEGLPLEPLRIRTV